MKTASKARGGYAGGATANLLPRHRLRPWRMAATVPTLLAGVPAWQVVQRFNRGLLLSACGDGLRGGSVLFIGTDETSSGPFHLQLAAPQFAQLRLANVLSLTSGGSGLLVVNGGGNGGGDSDGGSLVASGGGGDGGSLVASDVSIETSGVPCYNVEAPALMPHAIPFALRELSAFLACNAQPTGLGLAPFALLAPDGPLPCAPEELAQELRQTGQSPQQAFQRLTSYLVGRGLGLTPSGDDLLVGMMAVLPSPVLQAAVMRRADADVTSIVSRAYFSAATKRQFDEDICRLLDAANHKETELFARLCSRIARHGHSSGIDLLTGVLYALRILNTTKEQE